MKKLGEKAESKIKTKIGVQIKKATKAFAGSPKALYLWWALATLYAVGGVTYLMNTAGLAEQADRLGFSQSALSAVAFGLIAYMLRQVYFSYLKIEDVKQRKRRFLFAFLFGTLLGLSFILGYQLRMIGNTLPGYKAKLVALIMAGGCGMAVLPLTSLWFALLDSFRGSKEREPLAAKTKRKIFLFSWLAIFLCWIPVFLAYYPAIMSYDFHRQSGEAYRGYIWFNDHHPLVHTFLIRVFLLLGEAIGSYELGMAFFSLLQMLILSVVLAYSCNVVGRMTRRVWPVVVMVVVYGLLPVHPVLAMSMTKDILFSAFFLLMILLMWERRRFFTEVGAGTAKDKRKLAGLSVALVLAGILAMLLRNNAVYAFAVFAVIYVIYASKERVIIAVLCVAILAGGLGCKTAIREAMDAGTGSSAEMYSVFMQQFARVGVKQRAALSEEELAIVTYYVPEEHWTNYNPPLADGVKALVTVTSFQEWKDDIPQMIADWIKIGLRYPNEYIDAFLALTGGYWFLDDVSHAEVLGYGEDTNLGLLYTFNASSSEHFEGVESKSLLPGLLSAYQKIVNGNSYYEWPVISVLFKPAFYCWLLVLALASYWYLKAPKKAVWAMFPLLYLLTLLLGPVVNMRYVYPIMIVIPLLFASVFCKDEQGRDVQNQDVQRNE